MDVIFLQSPTTRIHGEKGKADFHPSSCSAASAACEFRFFNALSFYSDGNGINTRELIQCIHAGNYETLLESHGVALQEMANTFFCNHNERRIFLKSLERNLKRLTDIQINGYFPALDLDRAASMAESEEADQEDATQDSRPESATAKKKKKKKKKKQAQKEAEVAKSSEASVTPAPSFLGPEEEETEDPLVTALLGMGFTEDQISAAVKACGGTNRATADDLVTWILCGGENDNVGGNIDDQETTDNQQSFHDVAAEVNESTVVKAKVVDEAKFAEEAARQKEEAARQQEMAAKKLAAKREEQRRRNREWNNREQARQQEEAKAKMAQALAGPRPAPPAPGYAADYPSLQSIAPVGLQTGVPNNGLQAGFPPGMMTGLPVAQPSQQAPPMPVSTASFLPISNPMIHQAPPMPLNQALPNMPPHLMAGSGFPSLSQTMLHAQGVSEPTGPVMGGAYAFPPIGDDDRTVSSYGSNRGLSASSNSFVSSFPPPVAMPQYSVAPNAAVPPPGFRPPVAAPPRARPPANQQTFAPPPVETNPATRAFDSNNPLSPNMHGEIRATARSFVPSNFTPAAPPSASTNIPPMSSRFAESSSFPPPASMGSFEQNSAAFPSGLLSGTGGTSSLLSSSLPSSYDRVPSVTPVSEDSAHAASAGSSLGAVPIMEEAPVGIPLGVGTSDSQSRGATSLLGSAFANGPPVGGALSIWGGDQSNVPPLGGLQPFSSFGEGGNRERSRSGDGPSLGGKGTNWAAPGGSNPANAPGSIW